MIDFTKQVTISDEPGITNERFRPSASCKLQPTPHIAVVNRHNRYMTRHACTAVTYSYITPTYKAHQSLEHWWDSLKPAVTLAEAILWRVFTTTSSDQWEDTLGRSVKVDGAWRTEWCLAQHYTVAGMSLSLLRIARRPTSIQWPTISW